MSILEIQFIRRNERIKQSIQIRNHYKDNKIEFK